MQQKAEPGRRAGRLQPWITKLKFHNPFRQKMIQNSECISEKFSLAVNSFPSPKIPSIIIMSFLRNANWPQVPKSIQTYHWKNDVGKHTEKMVVLVSTKVKPGRLA